MKYCSNCGNKVENDQVFCNKCGKKVSGDVDTNQNNSRPNDNSGSFSNREKGHYYLKEDKNKSNVVVIVLSIIVAIILLGALIVGGYFLFKNLNININNGDSSESNANNQRISINVLSDQFSSDFMKSDNTEGYDGFNVGMSKNDIKEEFGEPENVESMDFGEVEKYGDIGVVYDSDSTVSSVYVLPEDISVNAFKQFHGEPTMQSKDQLIYDDNTDNGFTIFINVKDGEIQSIENGYQMDRN